MLVDLTTILNHYIIPAIISMVTSIVSVIINCWLNISLSNNMISKKKNLEQVFISYPKLKMYYHKIKEELFPNQKYLVIYFIISLGFPYLAGTLLFLIFLLHNNYDALKNISRSMFTYVYLFIFFNYILIFFTDITATIRKNNRCSRYSIKIFYICLISVISLIFLAVFVFCMIEVLLTKILGIHNIIIILKLFLSNKYINYIVGNIIILVILLFWSYKYIIRDIINSEREKIIYNNILPNLHSNKIIIKIYTAHYKIKGVIWNIFDDKHIVIKDGPYLAYIPWNEIEFIEIEETSNENDTIINDE